jgi:hypothetical protein
MVIPPGSRVFRYQGVGTGPYKAYHHVTHRYLIRITSVIQGGHNCLLLYPLGPVKLVSYHIDTSIPVPARASQDGQ